VQKTTLPDLVPKIKSASSCNSAPQIRRDVAVRISLRAGSRHLPLYRAHLTPRYHTLFEVCM